MTVDESDVSLQKLGCEQDTQGVMDLTEVFWLYLSGGGPGSLVELEARSSAPSTSTPNSKTFFQRTNRTHFT